MESRNPPRELPEEFVEIWRALSEADANAPSRQELSRHLGVSTHTIQRILVDGDVPPLSETDNVRIVRSWVRILTRLAMRLGRDPREWIEAVGIKWDPDIRGVSESALRKVQMPAEGVSVGESLLPCDPLWDILDRARRDHSPHVRAGIVESGALALPLPATGASFLTTYAQRLVGAVEHNWDVEIEGLPEAEILATLGRSPSPIHLAAGVAETVQRRRSGVDFLAIPGWRLRLSAACVQRRDQDRTLPAWSDVLSAVEEKGPSFLVPEDGLAHQFLRGQCGIPSARLLVRSSSAPEDLASSLLRETRRRPERWIILVCNEETCRRTIRALEDTRWFTDSYSARTLPGAPEECPSYPVGIAFRAGAHTWRDLLHASTELELFGNSYRRTARLYAETVAASFFQTFPDDLPEARALLSVWRPVAFDQATVEFQEEFSSHLLRTLEDLLIPRLTTAGVSLPEDRLSAVARERTAAYAAHLVPPEWLPVLESIRKQDKPEEVADVHCRSCAVSLLDKRNRGVSDCYCRICADETGTLRPRPEILQLIAKWFEDWQGDISHDEALRRADLFMQGLPAWNKN